MLRGPGALDTSGAATMSWRRSCGVFALLFPQIIENLRQFLGEPVASAEWLLLAVKVGLEKHRAARVISLPHQIRNPLERWYPARRVLRHRRAADHQQIEPVQPRESDRLQHRFDR